MTNLHKKTIQKEDPLKGYTNPDEFFHLASPDPKLWLKWHTFNEKQIPLVSEKSKSLVNRPKFSIILYVSGIDHSQARDTIHSVCEQIYENWQMIICCPETVSGDFLDDHIKRDERILCCQDSGSTSKADLYNLAVKKSDGDFLMFSDEKDLIGLNALYAFAEVINKTPEADMIYSDEAYTEDDNGRVSVHLKPGWCPDSFMSRMYTGSLTAFKRSLFDQTGGFRNGYPGAEMYDFILRFTEITGNITHIPEILYFSRTSYLEKFSKDEYDRSARKAVDEALQRQGMGGNAERLDGLPGHFIARYKIKQHSLVSLIMLTYEHADMLDECLESIFSKTVYPHFEVVLMDRSNSSEMTEVISKWMGREPERIKRVPNDMPFNFSKLNNRAAAFARGDYYLFISDDTKVIHGDWIDAMVEYAQKPETGAVGGLLYYEDKRIQHAGILVGLGGGCAHAHRFEASETDGYFGQVKTVNNYLAVTAACLMCRKDIFLEVGGFEEDLANEYSDVGLCLKMIDKGYRNVYLPHVRLYHYEAKTRKKDAAEMDRAKTYIKKRWPEYFNHDPSYHPELTRNAENFNLAVHKRFGEPEIYREDTVQNIIGKDEKFYGKIDEVYIIPEHQVILVRGWAMTLEGRRFNHVRIFLDGNCLGDGKTGVLRSDIRASYMDDSYTKHPGFMGFFKLKDLISNRMSLDLEFLWAEGEMFKHGDIYNFDLSPVI